VEEKWSKQNTKWSKIFLQIRLFTPTYLNNFKLSDDTTIVNIIVLWISFSEGPDMCTLGSVSLSLNETLVTNIDDTNCMCVTPPEFTCIKFGTPTKAAAARAAGKPVDVV